MTKTVHRRNEVKKTRSAFCAFSLMSLLLAAGRLSADPMSAEYRRLWGPDVQGEIDARIERCRKADASFDGFPAGAKVAVEQVSHDFKFGAHIFNFDQLGSDAANDAYKATFTNLLNAATVAYYWGSYEPEKDGGFRHAPGPRDNAAFWNSVAALSPKEKYERFVEYRRPAPDPILDFCGKNGIDVHGHVMIYRAFHPKWVEAPGVSDTDILAAYRRHIRELAAHCGTRLSQWDVVNESVRRDASVDAPDDSVFWGDPARRVPPDYTFACFDEAAKCLPVGVRTVINEACTVDDVYLAFVKSLMDRGAKIDVVGLQFHIFKSGEMVDLAHGAHHGRRGYNYTPERIMRTLANADRLGRPIHISEITVPAPEESAWGEAVQAEALRDLYRLWFSWPSVYRITYWNLVDFTYHKESLSSGFFRRDMSRKPVYDVLDNLINREWRTRLDAVADAQGRISFRGFRGRYRLSWKDADGTAQSRVVDVPCQKAASTASGRTVTVRPKATDEVLTNPDMGFVYYKYSNRLWAYVPTALPRSRCRSAGRLARRAGTWSGRFV